MLRVLLIDDTPRKVGRLRTALIEAGFEVIEESGLTIDLPERVEAIRPDVVLIDTDSPGRDVMEQVVMVTRDQPRPIVMFTDDSNPDAMRQAIRAAGCPKARRQALHCTQCPAYRPVRPGPMRWLSQPQALRHDPKARPTASCCTNFAPRA